ncbi:MFS transporter [Penicillium riverlandense]|uniref:MFS transporter n=1 Tax=Penicillium riverlandense TaxID=1903569 RepID=UPI002548C1A1|nr:MFS transporter [Penicillium riverlandense]KAJ5832903.1 MFS transporter [Penicillium riverlandense]
MFFASHSVTDVFYSSQARFPERNSYLMIETDTGLVGWGERYLLIVERGLGGGGGGGNCRYWVDILFSHARIPVQCSSAQAIERDLAVWRIEQEAGVGEAHEEVGTLHGFLLALTDVKIWALVFCVILSQALNSALNFLPTIVATLVYNETLTLVLTAPPYLVQCNEVLYWPIILSLVMGAVGFVIPLATTNLGARYFAIMLFPGATIGPQIPFYKALNLHMARPYPKRTAGVALLNAIGGTSNVWGSYL